MSKPIILISSDEYKTACAMKCRYSGFVYDLNGLLFRAESWMQTYVADCPDYPNERSILYTKGTRFYRHEYVTKLTVVDLEGYDFVFGMGGEFLEVKPESDTERKGQIYIRQVKQKRSVTQVESEIFEDIKIEDMKNMLSPEAYSKIFTCIIDIVMRNDLKMLRNQEISVQRFPATVDRKWSIYNMVGDEWHSGTRTNAFYGPIEFYKDHLVVAIVRGNKANRTNLDHYSTIWNVLNLLGAHELIGHGVMNSLNDDYGTHYLTYGFQITHYSWKYTTRKFKEEMTYNFHDHYNWSREVETRNLDSGIYPWLKSSGVYQPSYLSERTDSLFLRNSLSPLFEDTSSMKRWGDELKKFPKLRDSKKW